MTVRTYRWIIGNAWGKPAGMAGPEHHFTYTPGRNEWKSDCGQETIEGDDQFGGVYSVSLTFENNPIKWNRCDECIAIFMETDYGKKFGIHPPYRDALEDDFQDGDVL